MNTVFGENIGKIMSSRGITQECLEKMSGVSRQTINKAIQISANNSYNIKIKTAISLSKGLDVDFPKLFSRLTNEEVKNISNYLEDDYLGIFIQNVIRLNKGKNQKSLTAEPEVKEATISDILKYKVSDPYLSSVIYISEMLKVGIDSLFIRGGIESDF